MPRSNLYRLSTTTFSKAFPKLVESIIRKGHRLVVLCKDKEEMIYWDKILWTHSSLSFIPHGIEDDPDPEEQPVFLTINHQEILNNAEVLFCNFEVNPKPRIKVIVSMFPENEEDNIVGSHVKFLEKISDRITIFKENNGSWTQ